VSLDHFLLDIWEYPFTFRKLKMANGNQLKIVSRKKTQQLGSFELNSVLTNLPMFMLSFFQIAKGVRKRLDFYISLFFCMVVAIRESITDWVDYHL
jgi:cyanate permease